MVEKILNGLLCFVGFLMVYSILLLFFNHKGRLKTKEFFIWYSFAVFLSGASYFGISDVNTQ